MANDFTGRIWKITTTGSIPFANFRVKGGVWTGMTASAVATLTDEAGRTYDFTSPANGDQLRIPEMGWFSGPCTITAFPSGEMHLYIGK